MKKFYKLWLPVVVWAGLIFVLSSIPNLKTDLEQDFILRKIAHIVEFAILTFLLYRATTKEEFKTKRAIICSFVIALFYAFSDEYHQSFVLGRHPSLKDVGIDSIGILLMTVFCYYKSVGKGRNK